MPTKKSVRSAPAKFKVGDHVEWNSEAGHVRGVITKVHVCDFDYKGHAHRASADDPQYEVMTGKLRCGAI